MKNQFSARFSFLAILSILTIGGCQTDEEKLTVADTIAITEEATVDTYFQDMDDLGAVAIDAPTDNEYSGGRTSGEITINDTRFCDGAVVTIEPSANSTIEQPSGVIIADFGATGCTDLRGNTRKGKLLFYYDGWRFQSGSTLIITTEDYYINDIKFEGTRTSTNITATESDPPKFHVVLEDGKATFPDNGVALRESDITWSWIRGASPALDQLIVHTNSIANGTTRAGRSYTVSLLEQLQYNRYCGLAVSGIKKYVIDGEKEVTVDYGDGECDRIVTVTFNGVMLTITV